MAKRIKRKLTENEKKALFNMDTTLAQAIGYLPSAKDGGSEPRDHAIKVDGNWISDIKKIGVIFSIIVIVLVVATIISLKNDYLLSLGHNLIRIFNL